MTRRPHARLTATLIGLALYAICAPAAEARRDRTVTGDVIKAARYLQTARLDDARALLGDLQKRAPERFREDLLEAMKKKGSVAPEGYDDQIKRYYEELIR